ncbi:MAG: hypothetical protein SGJ21_02355 [Alphaproteobacteria bacterium]|nr:hypothetical protein [Alphaproteobacteria bacterium]
MSYYDFKPRPLGPDRLSIALALLSLLFPLIALLAVRQAGPLWVTLAMAAVIAVRAGTGLGKAMPAGLTWAGFGVAASLAVLTLWNADLAMRLYPVLMNAALLLAFGVTLARPPSMVERLARMVEPDLPESGVRYTRAVTWVWCAFFVVNGSIALWTALRASLEWWAVYNGVIAYVAMGTLLTVELIVRSIVRAGDDGAAKRKPK